MQRLAFYCVVHRCRNNDGSMRPRSGDFKALLDEHWATANREQVFFRTDPDAWRMHGKLAEFTTEARARRQRYNDAVLERLGIHRCRRSCLRRNS